MNLGELRSLVRRRLRDVGKPPLWSDEEIDDNLNEAEREACFRALLIEDDSSLLTQVAVTTATKQYAISPKILDVLEVKANSNQDYCIPGWTVTEGFLVLDALPAKDDTLTMRCYRLPKSEMESDEDEPEIRPTYHERLCDWAISLCYLVPDADGYDSNAAERYAARFTQSFGERHSALTMRNHRDKSIRAVVCNGYI